MAKVVVLGGGVSGYGSALLAQKQGFEVFLSDRGTIAPKYCELLDAAAIPYEQGSHTVERIVDADIVIKSPGIPDTVALIVDLHARGVEVISEIEFAGRYIGNSSVIAITGSNGKTTTTSLIYKILSDAGYDVALGGNIGESFALSVAQGHHDWYVLELSSFQLDGMFDFRADIGVLMNITPDHLDRYDHKFENYVASKLRIIQNQSEDDFFIYCGDDKVITDALAERELVMHELPFAAKQSIASEDGDSFYDGELVTSTIEQESITLDPKEMKIQGLHNIYNAMAASMAALAAGVDPEQITRSVYDFNPVEHRMEPVVERDGVLWINDSKATNVDSVFYALGSMTRPTVWIAGGTDKGNDYAPLMELAANHVHTLVCMGLDNAKLERSFEGVVPNIVSTNTLEAAMSAATAAAKEGDVVLLSPACASFDLFKSYEDRGRQFKQRMLQAD